MLARSDVSSYNIEYLTLICPVFILSDCHLLQLLGLEDLYVFNGGKVKLETTALVGNGTKPGEMVLSSLHVQNKGYFQITTIENENDVIMGMTNLTV